MKRRHDWMSTILIGAVVVWAFWYWFDRDRECEAHHGVLVRGAMGYACVAAPR